MEQVQDSIQLPELPGQGQAQPVPYTGRAGLAPALVALPADTRRSLPDARPQVF